MRPILLILPLIAALFVTNFSLVAKGTTTLPTSVLPGDSLLIKDTLFVNSNLLIITNTLKITDTTSRPIVVNGQWLKKRITITEYKALPSDTIWVVANKQPALDINNNPEVYTDNTTEINTKAAEVSKKNNAEQTPLNRELPNIKVTEKPDTKTPATTNFKNETQATAIPQPAAVSTTPETKPVDKSKEITNTATADVEVKKPAKDNPEQTPVPNVVAEEEILLPTRILQNSKDGKKKNKTAKANKTSPDTETTKNQLSIKAEPATTKTAKTSPEKPAPPPTEPVPTVADEKPAVTIPAVVVPDADKAAIANSDPINNISIEIIDNNKVIGVRTDLPEDNLPPGGTLLLNLAQPNTPDNNAEPENTPLPDKTLPNLPQDNKNINPTKQGEPHTTIPEPDRFTTNPNTPDIEIVTHLPTTDTNSIKAIPETPEKERVILESKVITLSEAYQLTLEDVRKQHDIYAKAYKKAKTENEANEILKLAGHYLEDVIANDIVYYWYGTGFDKEGTSVNPGSGRIACSYFVATMLTEAGVNIDRIKLAQQSAQGIIKTLSKPEHLTRCITPDEVESLVKQKGRGLYFIGFSYHVGFLYYNGTDIDLIHASPLPPGTVSRIAMKGARSFDYSNFYDIGKLTENKELIANWLTGKKIPILP